MGFLIQMATCILENEKYMMILRPFQPKLRRLVEQDADTKLPVHGGVDVQEDIDAIPEQTHGQIHVLAKEMKNNAFDHLDIPSKIICSDEILAEVGVSRSFYSLFLHVRFRRS